MNHIILSILLLTAFLTALLIKRNHEKRVRHFKAEERESLANYYREKAMEPYIDNYILTELKGTEDKEES